MTKFGIEDIPSHRLAYEAVTEALKDSETSINEIDAVVLSQVDTKANGEQQRHYPGIIASILKKQLPIIRVPAVCGGGGAAFWTANKLDYDNILVIAVDKVVANTSQSITNQILQAADSVWEQTEGLVFPAQNALVAQEHMNKFGTTEDDLALIAYKNHKNAALNPKARFYGKEVSLEDIKKSPVVASPFRLYDCSVSVNGAAAAVISKDKTDVQVVGSGMGVDYLATFERENLVTWQATVNAVKKAYEQADVSPKDIGVAELHDAFTIVELIAYEDCGFCKKGDGKNLVRDGTVNLDGKLPVNTSGGLKARGHPISPTGMAQVYEIVNQLRGKCGERQVDNLKYGLTQNIGGAGGSISVHVFKRIAG